VQALFDKYTPETFRYLKTITKLLCPVTLLSQVASVCAALRPLITEDLKNFEWYFVISFVWGMGGALSEKGGIDYSKEFSTWWKATWKSGIKFPVKGTVFNYMVSENGEACEFVEWGTQLNQVDFNSETQQMSSVCVPTVETLAIASRLERLLKVNH